MITEQVKSIQGLEVSRRTRELRGTAAEKTAVPEAPVFPPIPRWSKKHRERMASFLAAFVEEVSAPHITDILRSSTKCISQTIQKFATEPPKPGIRNLLSMLRDPEVQMGMMFMATIAKNMQSA